MSLIAVNSLLLLLTFTGLGWGQDILPEGDVEAIMGKSVTIKTLLDKPNFIVMLWNFNGGDEAVNIATVRTEGEPIVNELYKSRVTVNKTNGFLTLQALTPQDSGDYSISVVSDTGTQTAEVHLKVLVPVSDVVIKSNLAEAVETNSTVVLNCSAKGSFLRFSWLKGTTPIKADDRHIIRRDEELSSVLTYVGVLRTDLDAPITCGAANNLETETSKPFNITVYYGPEGVSLTPATTPKFIRSDANFTLRCSARSDPPAAVAWYRDGTAMENGGPVLTLDTIKAHKYGDKEGAFTCSATNAKTKRTLTSAPVSFGVMEALSGVKVTGPTSDLVAGNSSANLTCMASSGAVKDIIWMKDGVELKAGGRVTLTSDRSSILINPVQKEDNGEITCTLKNEVTTETAKYKMEVNYGPEMAIVMGEKEVEVNDEVRLTCTAQSVPPATFTWKFNGTLQSIKKPDYEISAATYKNTGTYTCEAHNAVTGRTTSYNHTLAVKEEGSLDEGLSDGAIAGIVIAILVALGAAIALIMYCRQKVPVESPY